MVSLANKIKNLFSIDLRSLALFRICLATLIIVDLLARLRDLETFYSDVGILPRSLLKSENHFLFVHFMSGSSLFQFFLFVTSILFALLLIVGYKTRLVTFFSWYLLVSLQTRNPIILSGADKLLCTILFFAIFLPLNAYYSIDSILDFSRKNTPKKTFSAATFAYFIQIGIVYFFSALHKRGKEWHEEASAVYYALSFDQLVNSIGKWFLNFPDLLKILAHLVWWFEFLGPVLLFIPFFTTAFRLLIIAGFYLMFFGFGLCLNLGIFPWACAVSLIPFIPSWLWDKLSLKLKIANEGKLEIKLFKYLRKRPLNIELSYFENVLVTFFLLIVLSSNISAFIPNYKHPTYLKSFMRLASLNQNWDMFARLPVPGDGGYVLLARLQNGRLIDLFRKDQVLDWYKPTYIFQSKYNSVYWYKYFKKLRKGKNKMYLQRFSNYLCHKWNSKHDYVEHIDKLYVFFMPECTTLNCKDKKIKKELIWKQDCNKVF